jgi:WD40 repeat protein
MLLATERGGVSAWPSSGTPSDGGRFLAEGALTSVALSADGKRLATCGWFGRMYLLDARTGEAMWSTPLSEAGCRKVAFSPDGSRVAAFGRDGAVSVVDEGGAVLARLPGSGEIAVGGVFLDDAHILAAYEAGDLVTWNLAAGDSRLLPPGSLTSAWDVAINADRTRVAVTGRLANDAACEVRDATTLGVVGTCAEVVTAYGLSFAGTDLLVGTHDGALIRAYEADGWRGETAGRINSVALSVAADPRGRFRAVGDVEGIVHFLATDGGADTMLPLHQGGVTSLAMSADGTTLYSAGDDGWVRALALDGGEWLDRGPILLDFASNGGLAAGTLLPALERVGAWEWASAVRGEKSGSSPGD